MRVSQRDRLGSVSHTSRRCASGSNSTIDIPVVVQRKGVGVDGTEGGAVLRHSHRTPWVPSGIGQRCVGRQCATPCFLTLAHDPFCQYSLGYWQKGSWARVRKQGVAHCRPIGPENPEEKKIALSLRKWVRNRTEKKMKQKILLPALHQGRERRCSRRLLRKSKFQHLRVARVRAASSTSWTTWGLAGTRGPCLGDGGVEKACLVNVLHLCQVESEMVLLDHHGGHRLPEGPRCDFRHP